MSTWKYKLTEHLLRLAASGYASRNWFGRDWPIRDQLAARTGRLTLEIVSHCWNYAHLLTYQLSSLVLFPPQDCDVRMTVFYSPEDERTQATLDYFSQRQPHNVTWNWWPLEKEKLFRRAIGRNLAALQTPADWIWMTDCDQLFRERSLDVLCQQLQGRQDALCFPREVQCSRLLEDGADVLTATSDPQIIDINPTDFVAIDHPQAIGPLQVMHGDAARQVGYCDAISFYQQPVQRWHKTYEDRALRWLLDTDGVALDVPNVFRIEHVTKGRYAKTDGRPNLLKNFLNTYWPRDDRFTRDQESVPQAPRKAA